MLLLVAPVFAQTANGRISGAVKDQTGGAIVGATVVVTDTARGLSRSLTTDDSGAYLAPNLLPGNYTVRTTFTGFQAWERTNIALEVGADVFVDVTMVPGAQTQTVTITEELPMVNTTSSTLGGALSNETINDLPVSGRSFINIMDLRPGVVLTLGNNSGGAGAASVNGLRPEQSNEYLVEGLHAMDSYTGQSVMNNFALNGDATGILSTDAIQEMNQQFNSKAEYGYRPGGSTSIGLKSGTNAIHATGFAFFRNDALDARNFFNGPLTGQPTVNNDLQQFGGTVGGPIKKDKLFFFLSYEQQDSNHGSATSAQLGFTDPSMINDYPNCATNGGANPLVGALYTGGISTCTAKQNSVAGSRTFDASQHLLLSCLAQRDQGTAVNGFRLSPQSLSMVSLSNTCAPLSTYPNATNGTTWFFAHGGNDLGAPSDTNFTPNSVWPNLQTNNRQISGVAKVDYTLNDKNTLNGFLFTGHGNNRDQGSIQPIFRTNIIVRPLVVAGTWTFLPNSAWANSFRVGFSRSNQTFLPLDEATGQTAAQLGLPTGVKTYGERNFGYPQSTAINGYAAIGARNTEVQGPEDSLEIQEQISYLAGKHSVHFGASIMTSNQNGATWANTRGTFTFGGGANSGSSNGLVAFLAGQNPVISNASGVALNTNTTAGQNTGLQSASLFYGDPSSHVRRVTYSLFVEDDWRIKPRLTLNLGLRYDLTNVPHDRDYIMGSFDPQLGLVQEGIQIPTLHNGDHNNFAPRLGFAWDVFGTGTTVVKGGAGMSYELVTLRHYVELGNAAGPTGTATAWLIGCVGSTNQLDTDIAAGVQPVPSGQFTNCGAASGGTYVTCTGNAAPVPQCTAAATSVMTSAAGFSFAPGSSFTSGGTRNVGQASWSAGNLTVLPSVSWDGPITGTGNAIYPTSALNNCSPTLRTADVLSGSGQAGRTGGRCGVVFLDRHMPTPYVESWNFSITHAIRRNLVLDVAYVGNHGVKLIGRLDDNQAAPFQLWNSVVPSTLWSASGCPANTPTTNPGNPGGTNPLTSGAAVPCLLPGNTGNNSTFAPLSPGMTFAQVCVARPTTNNCNGGSNGLFNAITASGGPGQPFATKFPALSNLTRILGRDTSNYDGLQITLTARNYHGLSVTTGYTWSHSLSITDGNGSNVPTDSYLTRLDYGSASSDLRHKISVSPTYNIPGVQGYAGLLEGWKVNGIFRWQSGAPFGPGGSGDWLGDGRSTRWNFFGDRHDFEFWSPDDAHAVFHPGGPDPNKTAGTTPNNGCTTTSNPLNTCVNTPNANTGLSGSSFFVINGGDVTKTNAQQAASCATLPAGSCFTAADLAINTTACTNHATTSTALAALQANGCWTRGNSVLLPPDFNTIGNLPKGFFQGQPYWNMDTSITKRQKITERFNAEFRFEFFNILNHPNFGGKSSGLTCSTSSCTMGLRSNNIAGGTNILGSGQPRRMQLGVKLFF